MQLFSVRKKEEGFSLLEILIVVVIIGVMAAIGLPSLISLLGQNKLKESTAALEATLKEAQRQAMKEGKVCTVTIDTTNNSFSSTNSSSDPCLTNNRTLSDEISIRSNLTGTTPNISFSHKGTTDTGTPITNSDSDFLFVLSNPDNTDEQRCLVVSSGLGLMRPGFYTGTTDTQVIASCEALP